ncbi:MAG: cysteine desulfurase [Candidatus Micrarchaeota archaeon]|nr:cysteine desulfurase [Candidatus Micrarchaeota archaeon]
MDAAKIRQDFPALQKSKAIYFDNACTTLKPKQVIEAQRIYYEELAGCAGRSSHSIAKKTTERFEESRRKVAKFIGCLENEVVWTKNATEALNLAVRSFDYSKRRKIVTTRLEHHSLLLPIMEMRRKEGLEIGFLPLGADGALDEEKAADAIDSKTALVAIHCATNTTGLRCPVEKIAKIAHERGAAVLVDGAQAVPHFKIDFRKMGADFLAFSGHKMLGPTGIGCLIGKADALENLETFLVGGETVEQVDIERAVFLPPPKKFEAGIQNYAGAIGMAAACEYLAKIGMENVERHEQRLAERLLEAIASVPGSTLYGAKTHKGRCALASFNIKSIKPHQVALMCDSLSGIALRSGVFCAQPAMSLLGAPQGAVRASLYIYNTEEEIGIFGETLEKISKIA